MEPNRFGRRLGIGVRVASRMAMQRATQERATQECATQERASQQGVNRPAPAQTAAAPARPETPPRPARTLPRPARTLAEPARRVGAGTRRFGQAFFGPFARVSRSLLLELAGLLFALFALFFAQHAWRTRASALHGPDHAHFLVYSIAGLVFLYFSSTSFLKANRRHP